MKPNELKELARIQWEMNRPTLYKELQESGDLEKCIDIAVNFTLDGMNRIVKGLTQENGLPPDQAGEIAWELMREAWLFLPREEET